MKISYNWLKDYLDLTIEPRQLADRLSLAGLEVEEVRERKVNFPQVVVGLVLTVEDHPKADKLKICRVDSGEEDLAIVCGAANVAAGQMVAVAKVGATLANGMKIHKTKIRGVESEGMICSEAELGLSDRSEGIWVLPDNLPKGAPLDKALNLENDFIFDVAVTPNRPDCLSHIGIAREIGAILAQHVQMPEISLTEIKEKADKHIKIQIESIDGCPRYSARLIKNVKVGESPGWLVQRLEAVGMRSINNVVDVTNYVLMETGHPLHAFDYDLIRGKKIVVRESMERETFTTLDDKQRELKAGTVLICDGKGPVAIGGIMGGVNSEVSINSTNVLLESAYFNPERIQISSRYLGLSTEASQRFERGADPNGNIYALNRAAQLINELCGGEIFAGVVDAYPRPVQPRQILLQVDQINNLLGTALTAVEMSEILESIDLTVENNRVTIPTFRPDLQGVADLAEEIARLYGLENIPPSRLITIDYQVGMNEFDVFVNQIKEMLAGYGLQEVITSSMVNSQLWDELTGQKMYPILNPISKDLDGLRNSLLPSLAQVMEYNRNRKYSNLKLFEINRIYLPPRDFHQQPQEELHLAIALTGKRDGNLWYSSGELFDFYDIKGLAQLIGDKISLDNCQFISYSDSVIQEDGLALVQGNDQLGIIGRLSLKIAARFEFDNPVYVAEFQLQKLFENRKIDKKYQPIPRFPAVERDLALMVDENLAAAELVEVMRREGGSWLTKVEIFDVYQGKQIPAGKKSLAFHFNFQSLERTLTEQEINEQMNTIFEAVNHSFQAKLRE